MRSGRVPGVEAAGAQVATGAPFGPRTLRFATMSTRLPCILNHSLLSQRMHIACRKTGTTMSPQACSCLLHAGGGAGSAGCGSGRRHGRCSSTDMRHQQNPLVKASG